jgi:chaperone LolA
MKKIVNTFLLVIVITAYAAASLYIPNFDVTAKEIIEKVQGRYKRTTTIVAKYSQTVKFKLSKIEQTYNGTIYLKKEKKFRIETDQQTIITDGITSWAYSSKTKQVVIDHFKEDKNSLSPEKFLTQYPEDFYSNLIGKSKVNNQETYELKLTPKGNSSFIKSMKVWVDSDEWFIRKIEWIDMNDNSTIYTVKKLETNIELGNDKFQFKPGKDVQVIDLRN